jgi:hypothetical protein
MQQHALLVEKGTHMLSVVIPKVTDPSTSYHTNAPKALSHVEKCDLFRSGTINTSLYFEDTQDGVLLESTNATACLSQYTPNLSHKYGYGIFIKSKNIAGRSLHIWIENIDQHYVPLDTYMPKSVTPVVTSYVLPPQDPFGNYYALQLENISVGIDPTKNVLFSIGMYPMPYTFITSLYLSNQNTVTRSTSTGKILSVQHPNESLYDISLHKANNQTLVLSQAYNAGWNAYSVSENMPSWLAWSVPFVVGKRQHSHVLVNNWENGWTFDQNSTNSNQRFIVVYLPQYLEYAGFLALIIILLSAVYAKRQHIKTEKSLNS